MLSAVNPEATPSDTQCNDSRNASTIGEDEHTLDKSNALNAYDNPDCTAEVEASVAIDFCSGIGVYPAPQIEYENFQTSFHQGALSGSSSEWGDGTVAIDQNGMSFKWASVESVADNENGAVVHEAETRLLDDLELSKIVQCYRQQPSSEQTLIIQTTKITQKSYGVEKRFLCPPTQVTLIGSHWAKDTLSAQSVILQPASVSSQQKNFKKSTASASTKVHVAKLESEFLRVDLLSKTSHLRDSLNLLSRSRIQQCVFKDVFVSDSDTKRVEMSVDVWREQSVDEKPDGFESDYQEMKDLPKTKEKTLLPGEFVFGSQGVIKTEFIGKSKVSTASAKMTQIAGLKSMSVTVVSKPAKRASTTEYVCSGSTVALFNRLKAQKITTKWLSSNNQGTSITVTSPSWQGWYIWSLGDPRFDPSRLPSESPIAQLKTEQHIEATHDTEIEKDSLVWVKGNARVGACDRDKSLKKQLDAAQASMRENDPDQINLHLKYGDVVVLQNAATGLCMKPMILKHTDSLVGDQEYERLEALNFGMAVGQLNRICFSLFDDPTKFLVLDNSAVVASTKTQEQPANSKHINKKRHIEREGLGESAIWTIVGVDQREYSIWNPSSYKQTSITPSIPCLYRVQLISRHRLLLSGLNFSSTLCCFFGEIQAARTDYLCSECMMVEWNEDTGIDRCSNPLPILLVNRTNGSLYRTAFYAFT